MGPVISSARGAQICDMRNADAGNDRDSLALADARPSLPSTSADVARRTIRSRTAVSARFSCELFANAATSAAHAAAAAAASATGAAADLAATHASAAAAAVDSAGPPRTPPKPHRRVPTPSSAPPPPPPPPRVASTPPPPPRAARSRDEKRRRRRRETDATKRQSRRAENSRDLREPSEVFRARVRGGEDAERHRGEVLFAAQGPRAYATARRRSRRAIRARISSRPARARTPPSRPR